MKYLILRRFWSFGKLLEKGTVVDEAAIRSPNLRRSEGKITPAVSFSEVPVEFGAKDTGSQVLLGDDNIPSNEEPEVSEEETPKTLFNIFNKKD